MLKLFVVLVTFIPLCIGENVPLMPGDNSHYVEGRNRYIWIPDGDNVPQLVDLREPVDQVLLRTRNGASNSYWLFTRHNPNHPQIIICGDDKSIWSSNYDQRDMVAVIVHGWNSNGNSAINPLITNAFLAAADTNVIVVDWHALANTNYATAAAGVPNIGQFLGKFLQWLLKSGGGNWDNVHLVGFGLGAHIVGNAGRTLQGRPIRITGLDPAGPLWIANSKAINSKDGKYVECIHTDGGILGIFSPICSADFYPNGGKHPQPGCGTSSTCSHGRAYELFAASVQYNHLIGRRCTKIDQTWTGECFGTSLEMGNNYRDKQGLGIFGLSAGNAWPF